jgi:RpiR family carbohydrate utilization transcriptional regulator
MEEVASMAEHPMEQIALVEGVILRIRSNMPGLRPSERKVARYIIENPGKIVELSVTELAYLSGTSDATVVKMCQRQGYSGFQELKIRLTRELPLYNTEVHGEISPMDDVEDVKNKLFQLNTQALTDTCRVLNTDQLRAAVAALSDAKNIIVYGAGASGIVSTDVEHKFLRIGVECHAFYDAHMAIAAATLSTPRSVALGISHSGATDDTVRFLTVAKQAGATTVCITNYVNSPIANAADITLLTSVKESDFRSSALTSRVAQLSIIDVLFIAVAQEQLKKTTNCLAETGDAVADR